jgi:hypothetical protein
MEATAAPAQASSILQYQPNSMHVSMDILSAIIQVEIRAPSLDYGLWLLAVEITVEEAGGWLLIDSDG